jgi:NADH:ubiquinone oxidoreductase subunit 3 (subunit A)
LSISIILIILLTLVRKERNELKERRSNFECGFHSQRNKNNQMSRQFFIIAILFLIFDVEIAFIIPIPLSESAEMFIN